MNRFYIYITLCILALASCSREDLTPSVSNNKSIEFIARPTNFVTTNVTTKATAEDWETAIHNAYLLIYEGSEGSEGSGQIKEAPIPLPIHGNTILPYKYDEFDSIKESFTACIIANVPESFINSSCCSLTALQSAYLDLKYSESYSYTSEEKTIYPINVPCLTLGIEGEDENGTVCMPMFGKATQADISSNKVTIELKRLFAKVNLTISMTLSNAPSLLKSASFTLTECKLNNLPVKVSLIASDSDSNWPASGVCLSDPNVPSDGGKVIYNNRTTTDYTSTCYIPEFFLTPDSGKVEYYRSYSESNNKDEEMYKPLLFDPSTQYPVYFTIKGTLKHDDLAYNIPFTYEVYLGENFFDNFNLMRNKEYNVKMTITGINEARLETDERVDATFKTINLADLNETGSDNPANCYIIEKIGRYSIPAVKGNSNTSIGTIPTNENGEISNVELITDNTSNTVTNIKLVDGRIRFDVNMDTLSDVVNGNTMLVIKGKDNKVLWSWHLWFDGGFYNSELFPIGEEQYSETKAVMMNRNLGASSPGGTGMYYKWGDKSPYFNEGYQGGVTGGSWGETKSVTDPCPPGYKVPSNSVWLSEADWKNSLAGEDGAQEISTAGFIYDIREPSVLYPFSKFLLNGAVVSQPLLQENVSVDNSGLVTVTEQTKTIEVSGRSLALNVTNKYYFANGSVWSTSENSENSENLSFVYEVRKQTGTPIINHYIINGSNYTRDELKNGGWKLQLLYLVVTTAESLGLIDNLIDPLIPDEVYYDKTYAGFTYSHGLQVRCVKK